ncbi:MAG: toll/interleukin-1 receptor domain-containing protein, partial [Candidatus Marinimicrobia bacterium]|nr:toll/interleukin-1 receptor domain-containing protein [Candidatus Neomarinimicrobiota bacterium]
MEKMQDLFISYSNADRDSYIQPFTKCLTDRGVTFWIDCLEISWGDSLVLKVNEGLCKSNYVVLCLSESFLSRSWPKAEMNAILSIQINTGTKKVLPLILNSKERILKEYPLLSGLVYREYADGLEKIVDELAHLTKKNTVDEGQLHVIIESVHTGHVSNLIISPRASVMWLARQAKHGAGLKDFLDTGGPEPFRIRWVLVDKNAIAEWKSLDYRATCKIP